MPGEKREIRSHAKTAPAAVASASKGSFDISVNNAKLIKQVKEINTILDSFWTAHADTEVNSAPNTPKSFDQQLQKTIHAVESAISAIQIAVQTVLFNDLKRKYGEKTPPENNKLNTFLFFWNGLNEADNLVALKKYWDTVNQNDDADYKVLSSGDKKLFQFVHAIFYHLTLNKKRLHALKSAKDVYKQLIDNFSDFLKPADAIEAHKKLSIQLEHAKQRLIEFSPEFASRIGILALLDTKQIALNDHCIDLRDRARKIEVARVAITTKLIGANKVAIRAEVEALQQQLDTLNDDYTTYCAKAHEHNEIIKKLFASTINYLIAFPVAAETVLQDLNQEKINLTEDPTLKQIIKLHDFLKSLASSSSILIEDEINRLAIVSCSAQYNAFVTSIALKIEAITGIKLGSALEKSKKDWEATSKLLVEHLDKTYTEIRTYVDKDNWQLFFEARQAINERHQAIEDAKENVNGLKCHAAEILYGKENLNDQDRELHTLGATATDPTKYLVDAKPDMHRLKATQEEMDHLLKKTKLGFFDRYPGLKKALIGAAIVFSVVAISTGIGAAIYAGVAGAAALAAVAVAVTAKLTLAGTITLGASIPLLSGAAIGVKEILAEQASEKKKVVVAEVVPLPVVVISQPAPGPVAEPAAEPVATKKAALSFRTQLVAALRSPTLFGLFGKKPEVAAPKLGRGVDSTLAPIRTR